MEIKIFLRLLLKRWWIMAAILVITVASTFVLTELQVPTYSANATFVVSPSADILNGTGIISGLSVLGGQPAVCNTYAAIAASSAVKLKASQLLNLTPAQSKALTVTSRVQAGTNVIEITVEGKDQNLLQIFTNKVGESTIDYVKKLNGVYVLEILDGAVFPGDPIRPNKRLNLVLGAALGLALGVGIAFLVGLKDY
jgi:capsular polysaccharide biosynthesis protein